jgi:hypothetical protein
MWFNLFGSNGNKTVVKNRTTVEKRMTKQEMELSDYW